MSQLDAIFNNMSRQSAMMSEIENTKLFQDLIDRFETAIEVKDVATQNLKEQKTIDYYNLTIGQIDDKIKNLIAQKEKMITSREVAIKRFENNTRSKEEIRMTKQIRKFITQNILRSGIEHIINENQDPLEYVKTTYPGIEKFLVKEDIEKIQAIKNVSGNPNPIITPSPPGGATEKKKATKRTPKTASEPQTTPAATSPPTTSTTTTPPPPRGGLVEFPYKLPEGHALYEMVSECNNEELWGIYNANPSIRSKWIPK